MGHTSSSVVITRRRNFIAALVAGGVALTVLGVGVAYWLSQARQEQPAPVALNIPADVHQQVSGYTFTRSDEGRRIFTIHAARTVAFQQGGTTVLEDVMVELFGRTGDRRDILRTRRCDYNAQSGDLFSSGAVEIDLNAPGDTPQSAGPNAKPGVVIRTSKVSYDHQTARVVTKEPVAFRIGSAEGSARGMVYATRDGWLELTSQVSAEVQPGGAGGQLPVKIAASRLRYEKTTGEVRLWGPVTITQGERRADADQAVCFINEHHRVTRVQLLGHVQGSQAASGQTQEITAERVQGTFDPASGELRQIVAEGDVTAGWKAQANVSHLVAQRLELTFAGVHPQPQHGLASGNVEFSAESPSATPGSRTPAAPEKKTLSAAALAFDFRPDGKSLQQVQTRGAGKLVVLPADSRVGPRVITAGQIGLAFNERSRLESLLGTAPTRIVFEPAPGAPPGTRAQESRADRLEAIFDPATQTLRQADQSGHYEFQDGDRGAAAERARYDAAAQTVTLLGHPHLWDPQSRMQAQLLSFDLRSGRAEGEGKVEGWHLSPVQGTGGERENPPTNVVADRFFANRHDQVVRYEGHVRAWQGADVLESDALDIFRAQRRLKSGSQVLTSHLQPVSRVPGPTPGPPPAARQTRPATVRADRLDYFDAGRKASYHGHVQLQTEDTILRADHLDVFFTSGPSPQESEIERAVGDGHIEVIQPGRRAHGEHAEYYAATGRIVLTGGPPTLYDAEKGFTTGRRLTFYIHDDRLFVDGGDKSQTVSKHRVAQ